MTTQKKDIFLKCRNDECKQKFSLNEAVRKAENINDDKVRCPYCGFEMGVIN